MDAVDVFAMVELHVAPVAHMVDTSSVRDVDHAGSVDLVADAFPVLREKERYLRLISFFSSVFYFFLPKKWFIFYETIWSKKTRSTLKKYSK